MNNLNRNLHKIITENHIKQEQIKKRILSKTYNEALKIYHDLRIVTKDDQNIAIILNFCPDRCNVIIKNNIIVGIDGFY